MITGRFAPANVCEKSPDRSSAVGMVELVVMPLRCSNVSQLKKKKVRSFPL